MNHSHIERGILGIDSGGTKCDALLVREDGIVIGTGHCEYTDPESGRSTVGSGRTKESVSTASHRALEQTACKELFVGGASIFSALDLAKILETQNIHHIPVSEWDAALALVGVNAGLVILSGTGSVVYGKTYDNRRLALDGIGPILGDCGSGYQIGLMSLQAAAKSLWHPRHKTSLDKIIHDINKHTNASQSDSPAYMPDLVEYTLGNRDRSEIASFANIVNDEANAGDQIAIEILEKAAANIVETVYDVVDTLNMSVDNYKMIASGGVITHSPIYWKHVCKLVHDFAPNLEPVNPVLPAVVGTTLAVAAQVPDIDISVFRTNIMDSVKERMNLDSCLS